MTQVQRFLLSSDEAALRLANYLKEHRRKAAADGHPLIVTVAPYHATRTVEQNQTMWGILKAMSEQVRTEGDVQHSQQTWNTYAKEKFLPEACARGVDKGRVDRDSGERELVMSTSDLNELEMDLYTSLLRNYATAELGVELRLPSAERQQQGAR